MEATSGFGNQFNAIMTCLAIALASNRAMLLDWESILRFNAKSHPNGPQYVIGLNGLITSPFFNWSLRDALRKHPDIAGQHGNWSQVRELSRGASNKATFCGNLTEFFPEPVVLWSGWAWLPGVTSNFAYADSFRDWFGHDTQGTP